MTRRLAEPLSLRHLTLRNRIVFGAHTNNMAEGGLPSDRQVAYLAERARGGARWSSWSRCRCTGRRC